MALKNGKKRDLIGKEFNSIKTDPPTKFISNNNYFENFKYFLDEKKDDQPFFFWLGSHEPHRRYEYQSGTKYGNKEIDEIEKVPDYWPDTENVKTDILDYAFEIEYFDINSNLINKETYDTRVAQNTLGSGIEICDIPIRRADGRL